MTYYMNIHTGTVKTEKGWLDSYSAEECSARAEMDYQDTDHDYVPAELWDIDIASGVFMEVERGETEDWVEV